MKTIGIMAALHDEIASLLQAMEGKAQRHSIGGRDYYSGTLHGLPCVVVLARIGKVAAAATAVTLIREFNAQTVVFTGLAGAVARHVNVGDIVVGTALMHYDLDVSPLFPRYEVPLLGRSHFEADAGMADILHDSAGRYVAEQFDGDVAITVRKQFNVVSPVVHCGLIISGDCFVSDAAHIQQLRDDLPSALCVEMEGAAVAQVCFEYGVPCAVIRTISDRADNDASIDFSAFLSQVARFYSAGILHRFLSAAASRA